MLKALVPIAITSALAVAAYGQAAQWKAVFSDPLKSKLGKGWTWLREKPEASKFEGGQLALRTLPGTLWGKDNTAGNFLLHEVPGDPASFVLEVTATMKPDVVNEQCGLLWYRGDDDYIKFVNEYKPGQSFLILGREEGQKAKTFSKFPVSTAEVTLRLVFTPERVTAQAKTASSADWEFVGECPPLGGAGFKAGIFTHVSPGETEHWAQFRNFRILRGK